MPAIVKIPKIDLTASVESFEPITLDEIRQLDICPGHLVRLREHSAKAFFFLRAGDLITDDFVERYEKRGLHDFHIIKVGHIEAQTQAREILQKLKEAKLTNEQLELRAEFLKWFFDHYWSGEKDSSVLDLVTVCFEAFFKLDPKVAKDFNETSILLYNRAHMLASFSVVLGFVLGYTDYRLLQDLYHTAFLLDIGLTEGEFNFEILEASRRESQEMGTGLAYLSIRASRSDYDLFFAHPRAGVKLAQTLASEIMFEPKLLKIIETHHEQASGSGFPHGLVHEEISDYEALIVAADKLLPFDYDRFKPFDGISFFKELFQNLQKNEHIAHFPCLRVVNQIRKCFEETIEDLIKSDPAIEDEINPEMSEAA